MLAQLQDHLSLTQPPEMQSLYERANDLFDKYDLEDYQLGYQDLLTSIDGNADGLGDSRDESVHDLTMKFLEQITTEHQITLNSEATMLHYILVLEFVKAIEQTELIQECFDALSSDELDNLDKFSRCLLLVSSIEEEDSMLFLEEIPDCVIKTMRDYFGGRCTLEIETESLDPASRDVYREFDKYARVVQGQGMRSYRYLFEEEGAIGVPFETHFNENEAYLMALPLQALIYEAIGYALVSEGGLNNPQETIMACLGKHISDLERITKIQFEISRTLIEYRNEVSSGIGLVV